MLNQKYRLGLDLGTNSIGWAMLALNEKDEPFKIINAGVRIFSDGRNPKDGTPLAVARREARGMRRRRDRFLARKSKLMNCLIKNGLMPKDEEERKKLELLNPYELRTKALYEALNPYELGRAIFHLNQRRGFKSNRKETGGDEKEKSKTKAAQTELENKIKESDSRSLGEFFYRHRILKELTARSKPDESGLYPTRAMYESEFEEIKKSQIHNQKISQENWQEIHDIIFYQRPLAPQEKGVCQFVNLFNKPLPTWAEKAFENYLNSNEKFKKAKGLPRAALALPSYMKFRILSEVNNLKIIDSNRAEILLDVSQKQKIIEQLHKKKSSVFTALRRSIGFGAAGFEFNLEGGKRDKLQGNETEILLSGAEYFGKKWFNFSLQEQDEIVEFLLEENDEKRIYQKALDEWNLEEVNAQKIKELTPTNFKVGYGNLCKNLLQKLCAEIEEKNCRYDEAVKNLGFHHSKKEVGEIQTSLDYYGKAIPASTVPVKYGSQEEIDFGRIANPTVHVALNQVRKVVNAIIKENGNPQEVTIELARDLKISRDEKRDMERKQGENQKENESLEKELKTFGQRNNYENRLKLKLFKELASGGAVAICPYSGRNINITNLFSHEVEIEHILPFSKTYDDSIPNKTIAYRSANQTKGNRSPFEAFGDATFERIQNLPRNKKWRFYENAMEKFKDEQGFQERQLNDTRYLSKIAKQYLAQICHPNKIKVGNGKLTALLRHHWGLNSILNKDKFDPETGEVFGDNLTAETPEGSAKKPAKKNRDDHRHHAIDAVCIALTETRLLQQISRDNARGHDLDRLVISAPSQWNRFREDVVEAIERIIVSHKPDRGSNSQLHEETYYGIIEKPETLKRDGKVDEGYNFVYSKPLAGLSENEIERIRDEKIYRELKQKLDGVSGKKEIENILSNYAIKGVKGETKVKKIRLIKKENRFSVISNKQVALQKKELGGVEEKIHTKAVVGSNHHIAIWQLPKNLNFLPLLQLKGKKLDTLFERLSEKEKISFEKFKNHKEKIQSWVSKDGDCAITCASSFEAINADENYFKPHPAAKLLAKIHGKDLIKIKDENEEQIVKITKLNPAGNRIFATLHSDSGKEAKEISISFSKFKEIELSKIFITPTGKVYDSGPILKTKEAQK